MSKIHVLLQEFGLDKFAYYPYHCANVYIKSEPLEFNGMVSINKEIRDELYREEDYVHWDTDNSSDEEETSLLDPTIKKRKVPSLTALVLRTIFSRRCLGKMPKRLRKIKNKSLLFNMDDEYDINISKIITNLDEDSKLNYDSDSLLDIGNSAGVDKHDNWDNNVTDRDVSNVDSVGGKNVGDDPDVATNNVDKNKTVEIGASVEKNIESGFDMLLTRNGLENNDSKKNGYNVNCEDNEKSNSVEFNSIQDRTETVNENGNSQDSVESIEENSNHTSSSKDILDGFNEKINGKNYASFSEDDKNLLEELDAQIGENANSDKIPELDNNIVQNLSMDVPDFNFDP